VDAVILLLEKGADPKRANRYGTTALMQAARGHLVETVRVLLRAGADRAQVDENGLSAAKYARVVGEPPAELAVLLALSELGVPSTDLSREASKFGHDDFRIKLLGSWHEAEIDAQTFEYLETTGERKIDVHVTHLPAELDPDEQKDAISRRVKEHMAQIRVEAKGDCRFSEVRLAEARDAIQARFNATAETGDLFVAVCVYAAPLKFVTLSYRDFRPNLGEESRGRQASEAVASFRVK
jgi:hypothetical protein